MRLEKIKSVGTDGSRVNLWFDDGSRVRVPAGIVLDFQLHSGLELDEETFETVMDAAKTASARDRAVRIVSATAVSRRELQRKLTQRGERSEDAAAAADWLEEIGAVDDSQMARRVVRQSTEKGYGLLRIRQELQRKGIPREYWDEALEDLPSMDGAIDRFLERKFRGLWPEEKQVKQAADALCRRGHSWEDISQGLRRYKETLEEADYGE